MKQSRIELRIDESLKELVKVAANKKGITVTNYIIEAISSHLESPNKPKAIEVPTKPMELIRTAKKSIYSNEKRKSAKDSPNRTVIEF